jgi:error-prone DNA polymerase
VKGVREEEMAALVAERKRAGPYREIADLATRSGASRDGLERLAWAGALDDLPLGARSSEHRREGYWRLGVAGAAQASGCATQLPLPIEPPPAPELSPLGRWERIVEDYRSTGINLGEHPMSLLREGLRKGVASSTDLKRTDDGATVEVAGMVVARQRPETAKGITFMLIEDEQGTINLIVPVAVYERRRAVVRAASLIQARGRLERRDGAINVLVIDLDALEWSSRPKAKAQWVQQRRAKAPGEGRGENVAGLRRIRELAVAELRAVAPAGHSFGRRGR